MVSIIQLTLRTVVATTKVVNFKQITTKRDSEIFPKKLLLLPQR